MYHKGTFPREFEYDSHVLEDLYLSHPQYEGSSKHENIMLN